jgi:hypothetical protein
MASRKLNEWEVMETTKVFPLGSLPYERIYISDGLGCRQAPWTSRHALNYVIHLGPNGYQDALGTPCLKRTFIHELVHIWQGQNSFVPWGFMINSAYHQLKSILLTGSRNGAYEYTLGETWSDFNVEQQANIIENWYASGMKETDDDAFVYIRDNIRKGQK